MENLIGRAFDAQFQAQGHGVTLAPETPILYFGDLAAYKASSVRIVTVAINPSSAEFPPENPFERFPDWGSAPNILQDEPTRYLRGLNRYFQAAPYLRWFRHLGPVLEGFDAGFSPGSQNVALHTDFATPVATRPVWGKIKQQAIREALLGPGVALWHALVAELKPHLIVMSCGRTWLDRIHFDAQSGWEEQHTLARGAGRVQVLHQTATVMPYSTNGQTWRSDFVFCPMYRQPFGGITHENQRGIGPALRGRLTHW